MPTIRVFLTQKLQRKLRKAAISQGVTQRALIPDLIERALAARGETEAEEPQITLGENPDGDDAICGICGKRYKPSGIGAHIRAKHKKEEED